MNTIMEIDFHAKKRNYFLSVQSRKKVKFSSVYTNAGSFKRFSIRLFKLRISLYIFKKGVEH